MATQVEEFRSRRALYPWEKWCNGMTWSVKKGRDFACTPAGFQATLHSRAVAIDETVQTSVREDGETVHFQFRKRRIEDSQETKNAPPSGQPGEA